MALGALAVVPLATAEAADAYVVDDSGSPVPTKPKAQAPPVKPAKPTPPVPRTSRPANPTIDVESPPSTSYGDDHRQPRSEPKKLKPVTPKPANPTIYTGHPTRRVEVDAPAPPPSYGDDHRQPRPEPADPKPANPTIDVAPKPPVAPPIGRQPEPPKPANPTIHVEQPSPGRYADDRREPRPVEPADVPDHMIPRPSDSPGERGGELPEPGASIPAPEEEEPAAEEPAADGDDDGGFGFGVNVNLPGDRFDVGVDVKVTAPEIDPEWFTNPRKKLTDESSEGIEAGARNTKDWMDKKPICAGGSYYRYGGGGGDLCVDTKTGDMFVSGEVGVGNGGGVRFHRPDSLPEHPYCGGGVRVGSPTVSGTYERRYGFGGQGWYNDFDYDLGLKYRRTKVGQSVTRSPSKGKHTGSGSKSPWVPPTTEPSHRGSAKPGKTLVKSIAPGTINAYGTCGTPFRLN